MLLFYFSRDFQSLNVKHAMRDRTQNGYLDSDLPLKAILFPLRIIIRPLYCSSHTTQMQYLDSVFPYHISLLSCQLQQLIPFTTLSQQ